MPIPRKGRCYGLAALFCLSLAAARGQAPADRAALLHRADLAFHAGYAAVERGDLAAAKAEFEKVVREAPGIAEGHSALGSVLLQLGEVKRAVPELERALALHPGDRTAETNLAVAYEESQSYDKALGLFRRLDTDAGDPLAATALISYARALAATGEAGSAMARITKAVADAPADATLRDALGTLEAQRQNWPAAREQFEQAIALDANFAGAHEHLGVTLLAEQRAADAVGELATASRLAPGSASAKIALGKALIAAGDDEKALPILQQAVALAPASLDAKYQLALALQATGAEKEAVPLFEQVVAAQPRNAPALTNLGLALVQTGKSKEAVPLYQRALAETPRDPLVHQGLGVAYLQESDLDDAIREFRAGLEASPDAYELHYNLGLALKLKDDLAAAIAELELAMRLNPNSPDPPYTLGILNMQTGKFDAAVANLKLTLTMRPENGDAWAILGSVYKQQNNLAEAANALREAIRLLPNQPGAHITLAGVLAQQGKKDEAAVERKIAADLTRVAVGRQRATFATNTGISLLAQGKVGEALERFEEAVASDPQYTDAHRGLAEALARSGRAAEAEAERAKVAQLEKGQP